MARVRHQIPVPGLYGDPEQERIWCNWDDCIHPASSLHTMVVCYAAPGMRRDHGQLPRRPMCGQCTRVAFCSAQCQDYYSRAHRPGAFGKLSAGVNRRYL